MHTLIQISKSTLQKIVSNSFKERPLCFKDELSVGKDVWLVSSLTLKSVTLRPGKPGAKDEQRTVEFAGKSLGQITSQKLQMPKVLLELMLQAELIRRADVLAQKYNKAIALPLTVVLSLDAQVQYGGLNLCLTFEKATPAQVLKLNLNTLVKSKFPSTCFSLPIGTFNFLGKGNSSIVSAGITLLKDGTITIRADFDHAFAPEPGVVPDWVSFYTTFQDNWLGKREWAIFSSKDILTAAAKSEAEKELKKRTDFSLDSMDVSWSSSGQLRVYVEGEAINACMWIDVNIWVSVDTTFRLLKPGEAKYAPGRLEMKSCPDNGLQTSGVFESIFCVVSAAFFGALAGGIAGGVAGAVVGGIAGFGIQLGTSLSGGTSPEGCQLSYYDITLPNTFAGTLTGRELLPKAVGLAIRLSSEVKALGQSKISIKSSDWDYPFGVCSMPNRERPGKTITIKNTGTAPLHVCEVSIATSDPQNVFWLDIGKKAFTVQSNHTEAFRVETLVKDAYAKNPYPAKLLFKTSAGARSLDLGKAKMLSKAEYEKLKSQFYINPKKCFGLFAYRPRSKFPDFIDPIDPRELYGLKIMYQYDFALLDVPRGTTINLYGPEGELLAQGKEFGGRGRATLMLSEQEAGKELSFQLDGPQQALFGLGAAPSQSMREGAYDQPRLRVRRFVWRVLGEFASPQPLSEFAALGERIYAATPERVWGVDAAYPHQPISRFQMAVRGTKNVAAYLDHLYLMRSDDVEVYDLADPWKPARIAVLEQANIRRMAFRGTTAYGLHKNGLFILDVSNPAKLKTVNEIDIAEATDVALVGHRAAVACRQGVLILDVTEPAAPEAIGRWEGGPVQSLQKAGGLLAAHSTFGTLQFLNLGAVGEISAVGTSIRQNGPHNLQFGGRFGYALSRDRMKLQIYMVTESKEKLKDLEGSRT